MSRHSGFLVALLLTLTTSLAAAPADVGGGDAASLDRPDVKWRLGPAKYLLTRDEDAQFRKLKTDDERKAFIDKFWSQRDPSPGTPANEFKDLYTKRLALVQEKFGGHGGKGWEDDRGKAVLLLGPPDKVEMHESEPSSGGALGGPGGPPGAGASGLDSSAPRRRATFLYERPVLPGMTVPMKLEFSEESSGEFRLLGRFDFTDPRMTGLSPLPLPAAPPPPPAATPAAPAAPPAPEPVPEPPAPPTPQQALMDDILSGPTPASKLPVAARFDFYKTAESESLGKLTLAVRKPAQGEAAPILAGRLTGSDEKVVARFEKEDSFTPATENGAAAAGGDLLFQADRNIPPGKYSLVVAARDPNSGEVGYSMQSIEVPDFHGSSLGLSSVTPARKVERLSGPSDRSTKFVIGTDKILPAPRSTFKAGDDIWLYYQIYNAANDPASGQPKLKVSYRFEKVEKAGNRILGGRPIEQTVNNGVQAYVVSVQAAWPAGDYRVVLTVDDVIAGTSASATIPFVVIKVK